MTQRKKHPKIAGRPPIKIIKPLDASAEQIGEALMVDNDKYLTRAQKLIRRTQHKTGVGK